MMMKTVLAGAFTLVMTCAALAQAPADAPAAPGKPEVNTVQDWAVRCFPVQSPSPCDMFQELDNQRTGQRVVSLSIAFYPSINRHALVVAVPLEVSIPAGLKLQTSTYTSPMLKYRRCDRNGCYVEVAVENAVIESLARSSGDGGKIVIAADSGKVYNLNFSLKGFATAHDDMVTKAKAKAKAPAAPAAAANP
jgi:invasion protein IalB